MTAVSQNMGFTVSETEAKIVGGEFLSVPGTISPRGCALPGGDAALHDKFVAAEGLISTFAMNSVQDPSEALGTLVAAGLVDGGNPLVAPGVFDAASKRSCHKGTDASQIMVSLGEMNDDLNAMKRAGIVPQSRRAWAVMSGARKRLKETKSHRASLGELAPSYERAAQALMKDVDASDPMSAPRIKAATALMVEAIAGSQNHVAAQRAMSVSKSGSVVSAAAGKVMTAVRRVPALRAASKRDAAIKER